ncbi:acetolactate synthase, large subunit, biosynthetic type [Suicoccus acidiformans]|uniref:Acetolactate synthase n=1 Tax=Suicoccus acidiformans TaxID=2036206 RepID=A0A347WLU9_9LACT|nr:biosynthetic-type acetolactate synthase large subunit [Suicoccus acidiformans]AXY26056.1 acetolactate synthase, large subunit, biosynthetic type [Suicoccus acidiformans]
MEETSQQFTRPIKTGADLIVKSLVDNDVEVLFSYPGGAVLPIFDSMYELDPPFSNILCRHEQGLAHAAEGYARVTGKPGVVLATSGPGATNTLTGIADAMLDSLPMIVLTGQVGTGVIGTDAFQEADVIGLTTPISKYNYQIKAVEDIPRIINEAFHIATTGRPGPVVIDVPKNISEAAVREEYSGDFYLPGYQPTVEPNISQIKRVVEAIAEAEKPVVLVGGGVNLADASKEFLEFVERYQIPVVNSLQGTGAFPGSHELALGMAGMHGTYAANMAINDSDLLINIGARFDDRLTGNLAFFAPNAKVAHIDVDPAEIGKNVKTDIPVVGDAKAALQALLEEETVEVTFAAWTQECLANKKRHPLWFKHQDERISPQWLIQEISERTDNQAIVVTDVGKHQMWAAQFYTQDKSNKFVSSGGLGTMGFGLPAAVGAQIGRPDDTVVLISGDGSIQMTIQELAAVRQYQLPVKIFILNNQTLGMVHQWQELIYSDRYAQSVLDGDLNPDFVKLAEAYGVKGIKVESEDQVPAMLDEVFGNRDAYVVEIMIPATEKVFPMVPAGKANTEMLGVDPL